MTDAAEDDAYCADSVRRHDADRWLAALFVPEARRRHVMALYALDAELARARDSVSEALLDEMRFSWWGESIASAMAQAPLAHPVARALARAAGAIALDRGTFDALIAARSRELDPTPPADMAAWTEHAEASAVGLMRLAARFANDRPLPRDADPALRYAGLAIALADAAGDHSAGARRLALPPGLGKPGMVALAADHLALARAHSAAVPREVLPILWPATIKGLRLARLRRDPGKATRIGLPHKFLTLQWAAWRRRF